ncbi:MAG: Ku protein [Acidimicrobiia bacterium]|nr:Ku protein [Acidimicrobiia bacterium]
MARPSWSGSISFGMVSLPVAIVPAVRRQTVSFNQLDSESMSRIRYRKVADATGEEVPTEQIVRAADVGGGNYVVVDDDELDALTPERSDELAIEAFVPADDIDPLAYDTSYYVVPDGAVKPYALLTRALAGTGRVGLGSFVMRRREHLAVVRSDGERLLLSTIAWPDEVVPPADLDGFDAVADADLTEKELDMAENLVEAMSEDFDPEAFTDEYRTAVEELIDAKAEGQVPVAETASERSATVVDLTEALEASLADARKKKGSRQKTTG